MQIVPNLICTLALVVFSWQAVCAQADQPTRGDTSRGEDASSPYTPAAGSMERKAILYVLWQEVTGGTGLAVEFVVTYLKVQQGWAWIATCPQSADGRDHYEDLAGLLRKKRGQWQLVATRPCCGECVDDPDCSDDKRYFRQLEVEFPAAPPSIFPY